MIDKIAGIADTHTAIWYLAGDSRLSATAKTFIESVAADGNHVGISSITLVEMVYLIEKGRIPSTSFTELVKALEDTQNVLAEIPLDIQVARTISHVDASKVPDMPDRIISATSLLYRVPLVSRDAKIQVSGIHTVW